MSSEVNWGYFESKCNFLNFFFPLNFAWRFPKGQQCYSFKAKKAKLNVKMPSQATSVAGDWEPHRRWGTPWEMENPTGDGESHGRWGSPREMGNTTGDGEPHWRWGIPREMGNPTGDGEPHGRWGTPQEETENPMKDCIIKEIDYTHVRLWSVGNIRPKKQLVNEAFVSPGNAGHLC